MLGLQTALLYVFCMPVCDHVCVCGLPKFNRQEIFPLLYPLSSALCLLNSTEWLEGKRGMTFCHLICQQIATDGPLQNGFSKLLFQGRANPFYQIAAFVLSLLPFQVRHCPLHYISQALTLLLPCSPCLFLFFHHICFVISFLRLLYNEYGM